jgi:hypothetical protein
MMASRGEVAQAEQVKEAEEQVKEAEEETQTAPHDSNGKSSPVIKEGALFLLARRCCQCQRHSCAAGTSRAFVTAQQKQILY